MKYSLKDQALFWHAYFRDRDKSGWTEVRLPVQMSASINQTNQDMYDWLDGNVAGDWHGTGQTWLFKQPADAAIFALRWL